MSSFEFSQLVIPGPVLVKPRIIKDDRGFFLETYRQAEFAAAGIAAEFVQDNHSHSVRGVLRGLHYQKSAKAQGKLVRCVSGCIFDVAVDIRKGSPWYGKWAGAELSGENGHMLYVPPGFAHGFMVLSGTAEVSYKCTELYSAEHDRGIIWNDPDIGINWPGSAPLLSAKDATHPLLKDADNDFVYQGQAL